jgi:hypothetical protein
VALESPRPHIGIKQKRMCWVVDAHTVDHRSSLGRDE